MRDKVDIKNAEAVARNFSMFLPSTREMRFLLMRKIGKALQNTHGSFFFDQVYDVLELVYGDVVKKSRSMILTELEAWVQHDERVEFVSEDSGFYTYKIQ